MVNLSAKETTTAAVETNLQSTKPVATPQVIPTENKKPGTKVVVKSTKAVVEAPISGKQEKEKVTKEKPLAKATKVATRADTKLADTKLAEATKAVAKKAATNVSEPKPAIAAKEVTKQPAKPVVVNHEEGVIAKLKSTTKSASKPTI